MFVQSTVISVIAVTLLAATASAQPSGNSSANWTTGGSIYAVARSGSTVFLGGDFNAVAPRGQQVGAFAVLGTGDLLRPCAVPLVNGTVNAIVSDGVGGYFVGGRFDRVGSLERSNLFHVGFLNCALDAAWTGIVRGEVHALSVASGVLYVGGAFNEAGQQGGGLAARANVAAFNAGSGVLTPWNPGANGAIYAMEATAALGPVQVFVGGAFTELAGTARQRLGALDAGGAALPLTMNANAPVLALDLDPFSGPSSARLWVAGEFTSLAGVNRNYAAMIVLGASPAVDLNFDPNANAKARAITVAGTTLSNATVFVGGDFTSIGGAAEKRYLAALSPAGVALAFDPKPDGAVFAVAVEPGFAALAIIAGGRFTHIGGQVRLNAARLEMSTGLALNWNPAPDGDVRAIAAGSSQRVAIGGTFDALGAQRRRNLAAVNLDTGQLLPFAPAVNAPVKTLVATRHSPVLYAGGDFTVIDNQTRNHLAAYALADGTATLLPWNPDANASVTTLLATEEGMVYAGGDFSNVGSANRVRLAALNATTGAVIPGFSPPDFDAPVLALALWTDKLYIGGAFTSVGGALVAHLTRVDAVSGSRDPAWSPAPNGEIRAICAFDVLYAGGVFTLMGSSPRRNLAAVDLSTGAATPWQPDPDGPVNALSCSAGAVAGGAFTTVGSGVGLQTRPRLAYLSTNASGPTATYADSFRAWGLGTVRALAFGGAVVWGLDGLVAVGTANAGDNLEEPPARYAFFSGDFPGEPGRPTGLSAVHIQSVLHLRWSPPARGPRPTRYLISAGTSPGASNLASGLATASTQIAIPTIGAPLYTDLFIRVTAANAYGVGLPSEEIDILLTPFCAGPPSPPDELVATINGFNASFNWAASAGETFGYRFDGGVAPGATQFSVRTTAPTLSAGAPSSGVFYTRVRGVGGCGTSTASNELMVIVGGVERPPSAPQGLGANIGSFTLVTVSWAPPASGVATSYRLDVGTGFGLSNVASITTTATSLSYRGVPRGWYYFRVYAIGATGISPASDEVIFFVP